MGRRATGGAGAAAAALCLLLAAGGCWTSRAQGQALRRDVDAIKRRLDQRLARAERERKKLQKVMEQATGLLTRNSADVGAQVERMQARLDRLGGTLEELQQASRDQRKRLAELEARVDVGLEKLAALEKPARQQPKLPATRDALLAQARAHIAAGRHEEARRLLRHLIATFPGAREVPLAQRLLGDSYYAEQRFAPAILEYRKLLRGKAGGREAAEALYKVGMAFYQLKRCGDARLFLKQYVRRAPRGASVKSARKVLRVIARQRKNRAICAS